MLVPQGALSKLAGAEAGYAIAVAILVGDSQHCSMRTKRLDLQTKENLFQDGWLLWINTVDEK